MPSRAVTRIALLNLLVFFVLANVLYWAIPTVGATLRVVSSVVRLIEQMPAELTIAQAGNFIWDGLQEPRAPFSYRSHVGWRHIPLARPDINVEGPYAQRRTVNGDAPRHRTAYFFGGSTMWGTGVNDAGTIPSHFAALTGLHSENFGELGYTAHQSLALLTELLQAGRRPDLVVFYDGVNDALHKCRVELTPTAHEHERNFDAVLRTSSVPDSFAYYLAPVMRVAENIKREITRARRGEEYDCHRDPAKAEAIAENLLQDWRIAKLLVEAHGGKFVGILQPVTYLSRTPPRLPGDRMPPRFEAAYKTVYPLIRRRLGGDAALHDLVSALDGTEAVYFDWCHVTSAGNRIIAERVAEITAPLRSPP